MPTEQDRVNENRRRKIGRLILSIDDLLADNSGYEDEVDLVDAQLLLLNSYNRVFAGTSTVEEVRQVASKRKRRETSAMSRRRKTNA